MTLNSTKVIQSLADENAVKKHTNWVRGKVFQGPEQVFFCRFCVFFVFWYFFSPKMSEEKIFRCNIEDSVLQVQKKTFKSGKD